MWGLCAGISRESFTAGESRGYLGEIVPFLPVVGRNGTEFLNMA
jgi:hypothetical protein